MKEIFYKRYEKEWGVTHGLVDQLQMKSLKK